MYVVSILFDRNWTIFDYENVIEHFAVWKFFTHAVTELLRLESEFKILTHFFNTEKKSFFSNLFNQIRPLITWNILKWWNEISFFVLLQIFDILINWKWLDWKYISLHVINTEKCKNYSFKNILFKSRHKTLN